MSIFALNTMEQHYALFEYKANRGYFNLGDYVQSLAAKQYLPQVDYFVGREYLNASDIQPCKMIMNGWFMYKVKNWPPSRAIDPLFVSFHLNATIADKLLSISANVDYLKQHGPIGCRDYFTRDVLQQYGVDAYYSSCLTTTLPKVDLPKTDDIIFMDVLFNQDHKSYYERVPKHYWRDRLKGKLPELQDHKTYLKTIFPSEIVEKAKFETAFYKAKGSTIEQRMAEAQRLLNVFGTAKLVVTSRIHCALPCLAMGTPVLFVMGGLNNASDLSRLDGIVQHFNFLNLEPDLDLSSIEGLNVVQLKDIDWENPLPNPENFKEYTAHLRNTCGEFIQTQ